MKKNTLGEFKSGFLSFVLKYGTSKDFTSVMLEYISRYNFRKSDLKLVREYIVGVTDMLNNVGYLVKDE